MSLRGPRALRWLLRGDVVSVVLRFLAGGGTEPDCHSAVDEAKLAVSNMATCIADMHAGD